MTDQQPREDVTTVEFPRVPADPEPLAPAEARSGFWRELTGALALGLCLLALVVLGVQVLDWTQGMPGAGVGWSCREAGFSAGPVTSGLPPTWKL